VLAGQQASGAEESDVGTTLICHNVRYPVTMRW
jgi:hypothetical protein